MTSANNEEAFIEGTIRSVLAQKVLPQRWVIASDNSTDRTDEIVRSYARQHNFMRFLRITRPPGRNFGAKVLALHQAARLMEGAEYEFIGNLDADITVEPDYFEQLIAYFRRDPRLGLSGGFVYEDSGRGYQSRTFNDVRNVAHAAQLVRRECYKAIGGYAVVKYGGEDWHAQTSARMLSWRVEAFPQVKIFHHRHTATSGGVIRNAFRLGRLDYSLGSDPLFEVFKSARRIAERPLLLGALARLGGFAWSFIQREDRPVSAEFIDFLRNEQKSRIVAALTTDHHQKRALSRSL